MEITEVEAYPVNVPVTPLEEGGIAPYVTNHGQVTDVDRMVVRVETDEGVVGWGEMRMFLSPAATKAVLEEGIAPWVLGKSPFEVESLRRQIFIEYTNVDMFFSPIEVACWDILGKTLGEPVSTLLGGKTAPKLNERGNNPVREGDDAVDVAYCVGIRSPEESRKHAAKAHEEGFSVLKTKAGRDWKQDVARIASMAGIYLQYLEQPIRVDTHGTLAKLRERTTQPVGPNEDTYIAHNLTDMIRADALDVAVLDMTPAGGISAVRQLAGIAEDAGVPATHHCAFDLGIRTAAIAHTVSGVPGFTLPPDSVYYAWEEDVLANPFSVENGSIPVPEGPGLGIEVDEGKLAEYAIET